MLAVIDNAGRQGFPIVGAWWCDCSTVQVVPYQTACGHASPIAAYDGQTWRLWNVWTGFEQALSDDLLRSAYTSRQFTRTFALDLPEHLSSADALTS